MDVLVRKQGLLRMCRQGIQAIGFQDEIRQLSVSLLHRVLSRETGNAMEWRSLVVSGVPFSTSPAKDHGAALTPKIDLLKKYGVREEQLGKVVPLIQTYSVENIAKKVAFLESLGVDKRSMGKLLVSNPEFLSHSIEGHLQPKVDFLKDIGVRENQVGKVIPHVLCRGLQGMLQKITFLERYGVEKEKLGGVIAAFPKIFSYSLENNLQKKVTFLTTEGIEGKRLARLLTTHPEVLGRSIEGSLVKTVETLRGKKVKESVMPKALASCATVSTARLETGLDRLAETGYRSTEAGEIISKHPGMLFKKADTIGSRREFLAKTLQCTVTEAEGLLVKEPRIFNQSEPSILKKIQFLVETMGCSLKEVLKFPKFLTTSLESKIKPRQRVVEALKSLDLLKKEAEILPILLKMSEKEFLQKFVEGRPQAAAAYKGDVLMS